MIYNKNNDDKMFETLGELIKDMEDYENEIKRLENKKAKPEKEKKELIRLKKDYKLIVETINRANDYFLEQVGGPISLYYFLKELAKQGDGQAKKDIESMKPFIHKYMSEDINYNN